MSSGDLSHGAIPSLTSGMVCRTLGLYGSPLRPDGGSVLTRYQVVKMAPLPPLTSNASRILGSESSLRALVPNSPTKLSGNPTPALIFVKLRKMIASDTQSTETILGTIAVAAHSLTGATGAAVAMPRDGVVVCVGRSGETAPELGDRLNVDSGISGECLRTGVIMRCDDASRDFHVDAEVCRQLGLQSIAVVPLRGQHGRVGVLEAFSTRVLRLQRRQDGDSGAAGGFGRSRLGPRRSHGSPDPPRKIRPEREIVPSSKLRRT